MKVSSTTNTPAAKAPDGVKTTKRGAVQQATDSTAADETPNAASANAEGRDFASVLEEVSRPNKEQQHEGEGESERLDDSRRSGKTEQDAVERRDERRDEGGSRGGGNFSGAHGNVREVGAPSEAASARAILHIADLERIVSAVRTQALAGGRHEITIELKRSVLEGLQVKLTAEPGGRVTAEFIAASERVRAQLDARAGELAEILRSRGVNLASLRTTTSGADTSGQQSSGRDESPSIEGARLHGVAQNSEAASREEAESAVKVDEDTGTTYRA